MRKSIQTRILTLLALAACALEAAAEPGSPRGLRYGLSDWKWAVADSQEPAAAGFDDSSWAGLSLPATIAPGKPGTIFWLRAAFAVPEAAPPRLWFLTGKGGVALELYVNGEYAGSRGRLPPDFDLRATHSAAILLPAAAKPGASVVLAL